MNWLKFCEEASSALFAVAELRLYVSFDASVSPRSLDCRWVGRLVGRSVGRSVSLPNCMYAPSRCKKSSSSSVAITATCFKLLEATRNIYYEQHRPLSATCFPVSLVLSVTLKLS